MMELGIVLVDGKPKVQPLLHYHRFQGSAKCQQISLHAVGLKLTYASRSSPIECEGNVSDSQYREVRSICIMERPWHGKGRLISCKEVAVIEIMRPIKYFNRYSTVI